MTNTEPPLKGPKQDRGRATHYHFPTREDLFIAAVEHMTEARTGEIRRYIEDHGGHPISTRDVVQLVVDVGELNLAAINRLSPTSSPSSWDTRRAIRPGTPATAPTPSECLPIRARPRSASPGLQRRVLPHDEPKLIPKRSRCLDGFNYWIMDVHAAGTSDPRHPLSRCPNLRDRGVSTPGVEGDRRDH